MSYWLDKSVIEEKKKLSREDTPYDAMGDYSFLNKKPKPMRVEVEMTATMAFLGHLGVGDDLWGKLVRVTVEEI